MELITLSLAVIGAFYKLTKIESRINENIIDVKAAINLHQKEHELIDYQIHEIKNKVNECHLILKDNNFRKKD